MYYQIHEWSSVEMFSVVWRWKVNVAQLLPIMTCSSESWECYSLWLQVWLQYYAPSAGVYVLFLPMTLITRLTRRHLTVLDWLYCLLLQCSKFRIYRPKFDKIFIFYDYSTYPIAYQVYVRKKHIWILRKIRRFTTRKNTLILHVLQYIHD